MEEGLDLLGEMNSRKLSRIIEKYHKLLIRIIQMILKA